MSNIRTNRSSSRLAAVQALYQYAFGDKTIDAVAREFMAGNIGQELLEEDEITGSETFVPVMPAEPTLFAGILNSYVENEKQINEMINTSFTQEWPAERVELTLKAILQAGTAELMAYPETPVAIVITEYLDLTASFYDGPEIKVVNGMLDKFAKILREE
ncbi:MAG: transcription antitermination factor NusB [Alphaproteobacteria bacterium]|nr:transcription antitermination factor NusB [Alphaproteobacteria bacterium]